jgi:hypothetical protein
MRVSHDSAVAVLERLDGKVPDNPKVTVHLGESEADGACEITISGSAHASVENVVKKLGLTPVNTLPIKRGMVSSLDGYVDSEPEKLRPTVVETVVAKERGTKDSDRPKAIDYTRLV